MGFSPPKFLNYSNKTITSSGRNQGIPHPLILQSLPPKARVQPHGVWRGKLCPSLGLGVYVTNKLLSVSSVQCPVLCSATTLGWDSLPYQWSEQEVIKTFLPNSLVCALFRILESLECLWQGHQVLYDGNKTQHGVSIVHTLPI